MKIVNLTALSDGYSNYPYIWGLHMNLIKQEFHTKLLEYYPVTNFDRATRLEGNGKYYQFDVLTIIENKEKLATYFLLPIIWQKFIDELCSPEYIGSVAKNLNMCLDNCKLKISFFRFQPGDWVEIHTDHHNKLITQILYFNPIWEDNWGGELCILSKPQLSHTVDKIKPLIEHTVTLVRTDQSWHYVAPISENAKFPRLSVQIEFITVED